MDDWANARICTAFWSCSNTLRKEAKLNDVVLYVKGSKGTMVGHPAHKLLLVSASKYFKRLFEQEDLRNNCHFPHLSEDGLLAVLDIIYGKEVSRDTNLDDAIMAARFLQVDSAVETLEKKKEERKNMKRSAPVQEAQASPQLSRKRVKLPATGPETFSNSTNNVNRGYKTFPAPQNRHYTMSSPQAKNGGSNVTVQQSPQRHDNSAAATVTQDSHNYTEDVKPVIKTEPGLDLNAENVY